MNELKGRSTTEQVFSIKTLVENAITSQNYKIIITRIDKSAAFDTLSRVERVRQLEALLEPREKDNVPSNSGCQVYGENW